MPSAGPFAGIPTALSFKAKAHGTLPVRAVHLKRAGFTTKPPVKWSTPSGPQFDMDLAFAHCGATDPLDVNDMSLGQDLILADDTTGRVKVPTGQWGALSLSVSSASKGVRNSAIQREAADPDGNRFARFKKSDDATALLLQYL